MAEDIEYRLTVEPQAIAVELRFTGEADGDTDLIVPDRWAGQRKLSRSIRDLHATSATASVHGRRVRHAPGERVGLTYRIVQDFAGDWSDGERYYRAIVGDGGFHLMGPNAWVIPSFSGERSVRLTWALPPGWSVADSWGTGPEQTFSATSAALGMLAAVGGPDAVVTRPLVGGAVGVGFLGDPPVDRAVVQERLERTLNAQRRLFADDSPWYLVSLLGAGACCGYGGTGLTHAFSAFLFDAHLTPRDLDRLFAHEMFHTWNGSLIHVAHTPETPEGSQYWFSEGFTEFYAHRLLFRDGALTLADYALHLNQVLDAYAANPARGEPVETVVRRFWADEAVEKLPYQQGELLALRYWAAARRQGGTLDTVMVDLAAQARQQPEAGIPRSDLVAKLAVATGRDVEADLDRHVVRGEPLTLDPEDLGPCFAWGPYPREVFDAGFDVDASLAAKRLVGVNPTGPAAAAGATEGAPLAGMSVTNGAEIVDATLAWFGADGQPVRVTYRPARTVEAIGVVVRADDPGCVAWY